MMIFRSPIKWALIIAGLILSRGAGGGAEATNAPGRDVVWLTTGERLTGQLLSLNFPDGLVWQHPDVQEQIHLSADAVAQVRVGERSFTPLKPQSFCRVRLLNDDQLEGNLVALDTNKLELETWFAGKLTIPRGRLLSLMPIETGPQIFSGPAGMDGWTTAAPPTNSLMPVAGPADDWHYTNGAFVTTQSGSIARDVQLPDVASIRFDLGWTRTFGLAVALYANTLLPIALDLKDNAPAFGAFYSLQLRSSSIDLLPVKRGAQLSSLGVSPSPFPDHLRGAHVEVRVSKPRHTINLLVNGRLFKQWVDPAGFIGEGTCLRFVNQRQFDANQQGELVISNLVVAEWDGRMEAPAGIDNTNTDLVRLRNDDVVTGVVEGFREGSVTVRGPLGELNIPLTRVENIYWSQARREAVAPGDAGKMQALFHGEGGLHVTLEKSTGDWVEIASPNFSRARFRLAAFRLLIFQPSPAP